MRTTLSRLLFLAVALCLASCVFSLSLSAQYYNVPRRVVTSHGLVLRFNILGFAVGQLSHAHPNDRPMKDWVWQFVFTPQFPTGYHRGREHDPAVA